MDDMLPTSKAGRAIALLKRLTNKRYRDAYLQSHTRRFLAQQMRALRGERSQAEMGKLLDKPQSVVSRLEDPTYGKWSLSTLFEVAERLDKAVIVRFVDPTTFVKFALDIDDVAQNPVAFDQVSIQLAIAELKKSNVSISAANSFNLVFTANPQVGSAQRPIELTISPTPSNENSRVKFNSGQFSQKDDLARLLFLYPGQIADGRLHG